MRIDLERFLRGGAAAQQAIDDVLREYELIQVQKAARAKTTPRFRAMVSYVVEHPHVLAGDIPNASAQLIGRAERAGLLEWDPMSLGFFATMKARCFVGAGVL